jgi:C-terminal processing protease CtpA/Prc
MVWIFLLAAASLACGSLAAQPTPAGIPSPTPRFVVDPTTSGDEPVAILGQIPFTSPFFLDGNAEPFVLLEDESGFIERDKEFVFPLEGQAIGPVELIDDSTLAYTLPLPAEPLGTQTDVDHDGVDETGVMVFAVAYWSNTWGGPFLEARDGRGWSNAYTSARTDPYQEDEIVGGTLVIWSPDDAQGFPTDFGSDGLLFTDDDPIGGVPAGYSLVDLESRPFRIYKEARPVIDLLEGATAVSDFSALEYAEAFTALFDKASIEYPFTEDKGIDWDALRAEFMPRMQSAANFGAFYRALKDFTLAIPDGHVGVSFDADVFFQDYSGSFGLVLTELSDGTILVTQVLPDLPGDQAGIDVGAEILTWAGGPVQSALEGVRPYFGPFSTPQAERPMQVLFLTRVPPDTVVEVGFRNPGGEPQAAPLEAIVDYDSLFAALPEFTYDEVLQPIEGEVLDDSGLGYVLITTFSEDYNLMARLWDFHLQKLSEAEVPGLIIDVRNNPGGNGGLATDFAGYFFDEEILLSRHSYYSGITGEFEERGTPARLQPGPTLFEGPVAVLVGPNCVSACEGFVYAITRNDRAVVVGHAPTAGAFGEVGRGQYNLPGELSLQFPTGRPETPEGDLLIEGRGIEPDVLVPVTRDSALGRVDAVLQEAVAALLDLLR